jgi:hypothetical protein
MNHTIILLNRIRIRIRIFIYPFEPYNKFMRLNRATICME